MSDNPLENGSRDEASVPSKSVVSASVLPVLQQSHIAMNGEPLQRKVRITNPHGFHMRPATAFAQLAGRFESTVTVCKDDQRINGKSPLELMFLAAEQGSELLLEVAGPDAAAALEALAELLAAPAMPEHPQPPLPPKG